MTKSKPFFRVLACLTIAIPFLVGQASLASAYDGNAAAAYADKHALEDMGNPAFPFFSMGDCTNFVSQSLHAGGYDFAGGNSETADNQWWMRQEKNAQGVMVWKESTTWIRAKELRNFLIVDVPGGNSRSTAPGSSAKYSPAGIKTGDVLNYDWGKGHGISHTAIVVGVGPANKAGWAGTLVDYHTSHNRHAFWSLKPNNVDWATTTVYLQHVDAAN